MGIEDWRVINQFKFEIESSLMRNATAVVIFVRSSIDNRINNLRTLPFNQKNKTKQNNWFLDFKLLRVILF